MWSLVIPAGTFAQGGGSEDTECDNVVYGGKIGYDQYLCGPGNDPEPFVSLEEAYGGSGELEYIWMKSETSADFGAGGFREIPGATGLTYDSGPLDVTTSFARCVRRKGCEKFLESNIVTVYVQDDASATILGDSPTCFSFETTYTVQTTTSNPEVDWILPAGVVEVSRTGKQIVLTFENPGRYNIGVQVTENDCTTTTYREIFAANSYVYCNPQNCGEASFTGPSLVCDTYTVTFDNTTPIANRFEWIVETPSGTLRSFDRDPTFTFPGDGTYTVTLISERNTDCESTSSREITFASTIPGADFRVDVFECPDSAYLYLEDLTPDPDQQITERRWTVETSSGFSVTGRGLQDILGVPLGSFGMVTMELITESGCDTTVEQSFISSTGLPESYLADTLKYCVGDTIALNPLMPADVKYTLTWSGPGIEDPNAVNPVIVVEEGETIYSVVIEGPKEDCVVEKDIVVIGGLPPDLDFTLRTTCNGLEFTIENTSRNSGPFMWIIGELDNPIFTGREAVFNFTFPEEGPCPIYLIGMGACSDTLARMIDVDSVSVIADFDYEYVSCDQGSVQVQFLDDSMVEGDSLVYWEWTLSDGQTSEEQNPVFTFTESDTLDVRLDIIGITGCADSIEKTVVVIVLDDILEQIPDTIILCEGESVTLSPPNDPRYDYEWTPEEGVDDPNSPNPTFSQGGTYTVTIGIPRTEFCTVEKEVVVIEGEPIGLTVDGGGQTCDPSTDLVALTQSDANITWYLGDSLVAENTAIITVEEKGTRTYTVIAEDQYGCTDTAMVEVGLLGLDVEVTDQVAVCLGEPIEIEVFNQDPTDTLNYNWSPTSLISSGQGTAVVSVDAPVGIHEVVVEISNQNVCEQTDTIEVVVVDPDHNLDFEIAPLCNGTRVDFVNTSENAFGYLWTFGDPANPDATSTAENPSYNYSQPGTYTASLTIQYDVSCRDTVQRTFTIENAEPFTVDFDYELVDCRPGSATVRFKAMTNSADPNPQYEFTFDGGAQVNQPEFEIDIEEYGVQGVTLNVADSLGCTGSISKFINFPVVEVDLPDTLVRCDEPTVTLNPDGNTDYEYNWEGPGISDPAAASQTVTPANTSTYSVTVTAFGFDTCSVVDEVVVVVPTDVLTVDLPAEINACGETTIEAVITGTAASLIWEDSEGNVIGEGPSIDVEPLQQETYYLIATDEFGCTQTDSTRVINQGVNLDIEPGTDLEICGSQELPITITNLDDQDTLTFNWMPDSLILSGQGTPNPVISVEGMVMDEITVTAIVSNQFGCADTIDFSIGIGELMVDIPDTVRLCNGSSVELAPNANPDYTYAWSPSTGLSDTTISNPVFSGDANTTYTVTVTDPSMGENCRTVRTVEVVVGGNFTLTPRIDVDTTCVGTDVDLEVQVDGEADISWYSGDAFTPLNQDGNMITVTAAPGDNEYYAVGTDMVGCSDTVAFNFYGIDIDDLGLDSLIVICIGEQTDLYPGANPDYVYEWSPASFLEDPNAPNPRTVALNTDRTFTVTITLPEAGCTLEGQVKVDVRDDIIRDITQDTSICGGGMIDLFVELEDGATVEWRNEDGEVLSTQTEWSPLIEQTTVLTVVAAGADDCEQVERVEIEVLDFATGLRDTVEVCTGLATPINPEGNPAYQYTWSPATGLDDPSSHNPVATLDVDQSYVVQVRDEVTGCEVTDTVLVLVLPYPDIMVMNDTSVCQIGPFQVRAQADNFSIINWYNESGNKIGEGLEPFLDLEAGENIFFAEAQNRLGCTTVDTLQINATDFETGLSLDQPVEICADIPTAINPAGNANYQYTWSPATGLDDPNSHNPVATLSMDQGYMVSVFDPATGCSLDTVLEVVVRENISLEQVSEDTALCEPVEITLEATTNIPADVEWFSSTGASLGTGNTVQVMPAIGVNTYYVSTLDSICVDARDRDTVIVEVIDFNTGLMTEAPLELCVNVPTELNPAGNPAYQYTWSPATGLDDPASHNPVATLDMDQTYEVLVVDPISGCRLDTMLEVVVRDVIEFEQVTEDTTLCTPGDITLEATTNQPAMLEWFDESGIPIGAGNTLEVTPAIGTNTYYVSTLDMICGNIRVWDTVVVAVVDFQTGLSLDEPVEICADIPTELNPAGNPAYEYTWSPATGLDDPASHNPVATLDMDQSYEVLVVDPVSGCSLDTVLEVVVLENVSLEQVTEDTTLCGPAELTLEATTNIPTVLEWFDETGVPLGTGNSLQVTPAIGTNTYYVSTLDTVCANFRDWDTVIVEVIDFTTGLSLDEPVEICAAVPTPINPDGNPAYSYTWSPATGLDDPASHNPVATLTMDQPYRVLVVDSVSGCSLDTVVQVVVLENVSLEQVTEDTTLCELTELTLEASTNIPAEVEWFSSTGESLGTGNAIQVMPLAGTNIYYVSTQDSICVDADDRDTVVVEVIDLESVAPDTLIIACLGEDVNLNPNGDRRFTYSWTPIEGLSDPLDPNPSISALEDREISVAIYSPDSVCTLTRTVTIQLDNPLNLEAGPDTLVCDTGAYKLVATAEGGDTFQWATDPAFTDVISDELEVEIDLVPGGQYYYVMGTNENGCMEVDSVFVGSGLIDASLPEEVLVCDATEAAEITVENAIPEQELTYLWMPEDKIDSDPVEGPTATLVPGATGDINVFLENQYGCTLELSTTVVVEDVASAAINSDRDTILLGETVQMMVDSCDGCSFSWEPADLVNNPMAGSVIAEPTETTTFTVSVELGGCEATLSKTIVVIDPPCDPELIFIPRAFTPNGDGENDVLFVRTNIIDEEAELHFIIYSSWGQEVYDGRSLDEGWDGTFRGRELPPDVYGYYFEGRCEGTGEVIRVQGNVTLLR